MYSRTGFTRIVLLLAATLAGSVQMRAEILRTPLPPPSETPADTLFTRLPPAITGLVVDNAYDDPRMWGARYREFMGGGMGSGVAVGDFDGDGWVDLYVSTKTKPGRLFRNRGGWRFEDVTESAGLAEAPSFLDRLRQRVTADAPVVWRQGAVFADVNNDGHLDLYVCRNQAPNLLYLNQGDGTFREEGELRGLGIVDGSVIGAFADYDRDGWLDVLVLTNQVDGTEPSGRADRLFRNTGTGHFVEVTAEAGLQHRSFGHAATWFDYDQDRWPDFHIANDFAGPDYLYRNNGDGTFTNVIDQVAPHTPYSSMGADTADVDNDGHFDLFVADMATTTREKDRRGLAASRDDILTTSVRASVAPQYMRNALWLNTGLGVFREAACWAGIHATDWTWSVRFEDFDQDGWEDLHVTNGMVREANNTDLLAAMMRALSDMERIRVMKNAPPLEEENLAYRNRGGQGFEPVTQAWGLAEPGVTFGAATGDFDNDGDLDLITLNYNGGLSVYRNDSARHHRMLVRLRGTRSNRFGVGAIVRVQTSDGMQQSRLLSVARGYASGSELIAHFGLGAHPRVNRLTVEWPSGTIQEFEHLPADHAFLVEEPARAPAEAPAPGPEPWFTPAPATLGLTVEDETPLALPDREQAFIPFRTDRRGPGVAVADVNRDGHDDVLIGSTPGSPRRLLLWQGGAYQEQPIRGIPTTREIEDGPPLWVDVDGDGVSELLLTTASARAAHWPAAYQPQLYTYVGDGRFVPGESLPAVAINVGAACAADFDRDGDLDVFLGARSIPGEYPLDPSSVLLRNEDGRLSDASALLPDGGRLGLVKSALFRDVDGDGDPDLLLALEWGFVRFLRNEGRDGFVDRTQEAGFATGGRGWWNSLAAADFNGDGVLDFVAGNLGLNTPYRASPEQPVTLLYGEFTPNGQRLLVEAEYDGDVLFPRRARNDLGSRLPTILRRYPKNDDFARAPLADVFGAKEVEAAQRYEADNLQSGVFLSRPDGTFRFAPLPPIAQVAPIHGLVAQDLDGDGRPDIAAVQNSDAAIPHFHGGVGLFLRGRGEGRFEVVDPAKSGLLVTGSAGALVPLALPAEGAPGLFFARPGRTSGYLTPSHRADHGWVEVRLRNTGRNHAAIGARVRWMYSDGSYGVEEMALGGGWWSQSAPSLYLAQSAERKLVSLHVTWPDGAQSEHRDAPESGRWSVQRETRP